MNNNELTEREKRVLKLRYGLINGEFMSLTEVGRSLRVTRERIRQIEDKAFKKIRRNENIKISTEFNDPKLKMARMLTIREKLRKLI